MSHHELTPEQEALLAELGAGDRAVTDPAVVAALAEPGFRAAVDEQRRLQARLDDAALRERQALAAAEAFADPADERLVAAAHARLRAPSRRPRGIGSLLVLAAAAACLLLAWRWLGGPEAGPVLPDRGDGVLGNRLLQLDSAEWQPDGTLVLQWSTQLPAARFVVSIYDPSRPEAERTLATTGEIEATQWTVRTLRRDAVPPETRWQVVARGRGREATADAALPR